MMNKKVKNMGSPKSTAGSQGTKPSPAPGKRKILIPGKRRDGRDLFGGNALVESDTDEENDYPFDDGYKCSVL